MLAGFWTFLSAYVELLMYPCIFLCAYNTIYSIENVFLLNILFYFLPCILQKCLAATRFTWDKRVIWLMQKELKVLFHHFTLTFVWSKRKKALRGFICSPVNSVLNNKSCLVAAGCMFDKGTRHFYDDTCVVPEKAEGKFYSVFYCGLCIRSQSIIHFQWISLDDITFRIIRQ